MSTAMTFPTTRLNSNMSPRELKGYVAIYISLSNTNYLIA
jgi:hypothetical protein